VKVIRAKSAGFCWGVERAIDIAREYAQKGRHPVYTDGPLIHNRQMMEVLTGEGIREVGDYTSEAKLAVNASTDANAVMVVRAHGISPERREYLKALGMEFRDATCPDVGIIAGKVRMHAKKGFRTVIFGDPKHPEVIGLLGYAEGQGHVISSSDDIDALPELGDKVCMVSQSTMFTDEFERLAARLKARFPGHARLRHHLRSHQGSAGRHRRTAAARLPGHRRHRRPPFREHRQTRQTRRNPGHALLPRRDRRRTRFRRLGSVRRRGCHRGCLDPGLPDRRSLPEALRTRLKNGGGRAFWKGSAYL
jgi:(E)-4-hydroxy-3-methyl-but-2-enyl pyrophosphate reductase